MCAAAVASKHIAVAVVPHTAADSADVAADMADKAGTAGCTTLPSAQVSCHIAALLVVIFDSARPASPLSLGCPPGS